MHSVKRINKPAVVKNYLLAGLLLALLSGCNSGTASSNNGVVYKQFNYSTTPVFSSLITGVRGVSYSSNVYITGLFYESSASSPSQGMLYTGPVTGGGSWQVFNFPHSYSTSFYGPDNDGTGNVIVAGSYTTQESPTIQIGMIYQGPANRNESTGWTSLNMGSMIVRLNESAIFTFAHSTMGGLVVGNFDTNIETGRAFVYNINSNTYKELIKPGALSITAYGIWFNQGTNYTIAGGYSNVNESGLSIAYLADWNSVTESAYNWESFNFNNQPDMITHFEGITTDGNGGYNLAVDYSDSSGANHAGIGHVGRNADGTFGTATWATVHYPDSVITSANTVYQNYIMGIYTLSESSTAPINSFTAAVPGFWGF